MEQCPVDGCMRTERLVKGYCRLHYSRWRVTGDPLKMKGTPQGLSKEELLRFKGWVETESGCWEYAGCINGAGYGQLKHREINYTAHRLAYEVWVGPIPPGTVVRHRCDNPPCVNPDHLLVGTQSQNMQDMRARDRDPQRLLTETDVLFIRDALESQTHKRKELAKLFAISYSNIHAIEKRRTWKHV